MKKLLLALSILGSVATPVLAEDLCREQALEQGYVGAIEVLRSCHEPAPQAVSDAAQTIEPASVQPTSKRLLKARSEKATFGLEDVYTQ